jgi:cellulose synthase/poly-beta-1,6-N-acetylglucosamine synthase-like glycosyltransferase
VFIIFSTILFSVLGIQAIYPHVIKMISKKIKPRANRIWVHQEDSHFSENSSFPVVSILIPVYNEEMVIQRRLNNIFSSDYPEDKLEVIIVDSGSTDKTRLIIEKAFAEKVNLIKEGQRTGKASAINLGLAICKGEIVLLTDGATLYERDTIIKLVELFRDPSIGAASASYNVPNKQQNHIVASEHFFWTQKDKIRVLESAVFSTSWLSGEACAFRNNIINKVDEDSLADDSNVALQIISKGHKVVVTDKTHFSEPSPSELHDYLKIKTRRALGGLIETIRFRRLMFQKQHGLFGLIIFPYRLFSQLISPIASCIVAILAIPSLIEIISHLGVYLTLFLCLTLLSIVIKYRDLLFVYLYTQIITLGGIVLLLIGRVDVLWTKSKTKL